MKYITFTICLLISLIGYTQQLLGHINSQEIIAVMPEAATAQLQLQQEVEDLQDKDK